MKYFEQRFEGIISNFSFATRIYSSSVDRERCYLESLSKMDELVIKHDYGDDFSRKLKNSCNFFKRKLRKEYLGI